MAKRKPVKQIEYIDATPAAGKTREARLLIGKHLKKKGGGIIVYAAPTHTLIDEVVKFLESSIDDRDFWLKIVRLGADTAMPTLQYGYLLGLVDEETTRKSLKPADFAELKELKRTCKVILCTHECLIQAPRGETVESKDATVIFDEARNCVLKDLEIRVNTEAIDSIMGAFNLREVKRASETIIIDGYEYMSSLYTLTSDGFPTTQALLSHFKVKEKELLPPYVVGLYRLKDTCSGGRADVLIDMLVPTGKGKKQKAYIVGLARPSSIFEGYGRIIVMSAYFEHSQMYHLLKQAHVGHQRGERRFELVPYATSQIFKDRSRQITATSRSRIRVGALLTETQSGKLTSTFLSTGMVVTPKLQAALQERCTLKKAEVIRRAFERETVPGLTTKENRALQNYANPPLLMLHRIAYNALKSAGVENALCFTNAFRSGSLGGVYKIGGEKVVKTVELLVNAMVALDSPHYAKEREYINESMLQYLRKEATERFFVIPKSTSVLGLNSYDYLKAFVHLAALNPKPAVARVLQRALPMYNPDIDYAISNIIQTLYRTALRDPSKKEEVVCLVLTEWIIEQIEKVCFKGKKLTRIANYQPKFVELGYTLHDSSAKSRAGKAKRMDVPDEVRKRIHNLQMNFKNSSDNTKKRKINGLKSIAREHPDAAMNIHKWLIKHTSKEE